ncbi:hypothetical protein CMO91_03380 [Candidatus Woesearchaeota archaeon]|nr:hypothetical protein [Candidatus Woesearchaeota archaeon]
MSLSLVPTLARSDVSLASVTDELFEALLDETVTDNKARVEEHFRLKAMTAETDMGQIDPAYYNQLKEVFIDEVLPLYEKLERRLQEIDDNAQQRSLGKYVLGTVIVANVLELVMTRGGSLHPFNLVKYAMLEVPLGIGLYFLASLGDVARKAKEERKFFRAVRQKDKRLKTEERYRTLQEVLEGDVLQTEALTIFEHYQGPEEFWEDYERVLSIDPTTDRAMDTIAGSMSQPNAFDDFLDMHTKGHYSDDKREFRFNKLFVMAHSYFVQQDTKGYALAQLEVRQ